MIRCKNAQPYPDHSLAEDQLQSLVYGISHSLGAPLRGITQFSQLLQQTANDKLNDKEQYWFELVQKNGETAQQMIGALLIFSRLASQRSPDREFLPGELTAQVQKKLTGFTESAEIVVSDCEDGISGCYEHWSLLVQQLMQNAVLYHPKESSHRPLVHVTWTVKQGELVLRVDDNGLGVSPSAIEHLTSPFKRLQTENDYPGLGMGLTYCERIAQLQNGTLCFSQSELGGLSAEYRVAVDCD